MKRKRDSVKSLIPSFAKDNILKGVLFSKMVTSPICMIPNFIIIGGQRCGTTSLYNYIAQHPCVLPSFIKEVHYFDINFKKSIYWYRAHFPTFLSKFCVQKICRHNVITGEASPYYMFHPHTPKRVFSAIPEVKVIAILRNPVERAYSHYQHEVRKGREPLSFEEAVGREEERLTGEKEKMLQDEDYYSVSHHRYAYLTRGIYIEQLKAWRRYFDEDRMMVIKSEEFYGEPGAMVQRIFDFLALPAYDLKEYQKYNIGRYEKMPRKMRKELVQYYQPYNKALYDYLGVDFGWK
ncbi:MAG: sulfotransferase domain-containing protein [Deltaproteobacteria bacterium]|nr:sulfotransferase domain-containing protein [Deltaproteobacteria bacterium]